MIDLAPNSKRGLELAGPLILAGGFGNEFERTLISRAHALVTSPVSLRAHAPARGETRVLEFPGGFLLHKASANPGLAAVLRAHRLIWRRIDLVIILSLAGQDRMHWGQIARRVSRIESIGALELEIVEESDARQVVAAVRAETDLPIVAKVPLEGVLERAAAALEGGADALTIGLAPLGAAFTVGQAWDGRLAGPVVKPLALRAVRTMAGSFPETPLIAAGGVQTASDVRDFLEAGARAVQVDTALWRDPEVLMEIAKGPLE
jgi:dihydroorotate dehydrogenase (NAD+) catalytic subunit